MGPPWGRSEREPLDRLVRRRPARRGAVTGRLMGSVMRWPYRRDAGGRRHRGSTTNFSGEHAGEVLATPHVELGVDVREMRLDGALRDKQRLGDLTVGLAVHGHLGDAQLAGG